MKKCYKNHIISLVIFCILVLNLPANAYAVVVTRTRRLSTAYTWTGNRTASGLWPNIGYVAVHPNPNNKSQPIIKFGTILYIDKIVNKYAPYEEWDQLYHPTMGEMGTLKVQDMGDIYYNYSDLYWIDIYWGDDPDSAWAYGQRYIDYHYNQ